MEKTRVLIVDDDPNILQLINLYLTREGFDESTENQGFLPLEGRKVLVRLDGKVFEADLDGQNDLPADVETFILTVLKNYAYLL